MKRTISQGLVSFGLMSSALTASAQYSIDWFKVSGGGSTSTDTVYSVSGTIGQYDAGDRMVGANYSLTGGFWSILAVLRATNAPNLTITFSITNAVLVSWPYPSTGFVLEQTRELLSGNWAVVTNQPVLIGQEWQVTTNPLPGNSFYRLHLQ
jgi:hypothetical protein